MDLNAFIEDETRKRRALRPSSLGHVFVSHCSRDPFTQNRKMELVAALSSGDHGTGLVYWADFLDLWNTGSVNWRQTIQKAVETCTKVVAFVDREFLRSFNAVSEVISAMEKGKPVVPVILDDESAELLSAPDGGDRAWASSADFASYSDTVLFNVRLDADRFRRWWFEFSSINYVLCREQDFETASPDYVVAAFKRAVRENIRAAERENYFNEKALAWNASGRAKAYLLPEREVPAWTNFLESSDRSTALQTAFVAESEAHHATRARRKRIACRAFFSSIAGLVCASTSLFVFAMFSRADAQRERDSALESLQLAQALLLVGDADPLLPWRRTEILQGLRLLGSRLLTVSFAAEVLDRIASYAYLSSDHVEHSSHATLVALSRDGDSFASAADNTVTVHRLRDSEFIYEEVSQCEITCDGPVNRIKYADDGTLLVAAGGSSCNSTSGDVFAIVRATDAAVGEIGIASVSGNRVRVVPAGGGPPRSWTAFADPADADLRAVAWLGDLVVAGGTDKTLRIFRPDGALVSAEFVGENVNDIQTNGGIGVAALDGGVCLVFDANSSARVLVFGDMRDAEAAAFAPGGFVVVNGSGRVRTVSLGGEIGEDIEVHRPLTSVSSSPRRFALGGEFRNPVLFTRFDGFGERGPLHRDYGPCADGLVRAAATTSSPPLVVATGTYWGSVCAWEAATGSPLGVAHPSRGAKRVLAFDASGGLIAAGSDAYQGEGSGVYLLAVPGLAPIRFLPTRADARDLAWLGDGKRIAVGTTGYQNNVYVFDAGTGVSLELAGHTGRVRGLAASGNMIVTSGNDAAVRVWDADASALAREVRMPRVQTSLLLLPDGAVVGGGEDGVVTEIPSIGAARSYVGAHSSEVRGVFEAGGVRITTSGEVHLRRGGDRAEIARWCEWAGIAKGDRLFCATSDPGSLTASYILLDREQAVRLVADVTFLTADVI